jgi:hypothetical protein
LPVVQELAGCPRELGRARVFLGVESHFFTISELVAKLLKHYRIYIVIVFLKQWY